MDAPGRGHAPAHRGRPQRRHRRTRDRALRILMFSGIVAAVGRISSSKPLGDGVRIRIEAGALPLGEAKVGDSIAVQGVCLTVVALDAKGFEADVSRATLDVTQIPHTRAVTSLRALARGSRVNIEIDMLARYVERALHGPKGA